MASSMVMDVRRVGQDTGASVEVENRTPGTSEAGRGLGARRMSDVLGVGLQLALLIERELGSATSTMGWERRRSGRGGIVKSQVELEVEGHGVDDRLRLRTW